jgi:DNA-binding NtrC family response regulator
MPDKKVLVIDDEKNLCNLFADLLSRDNIAVSMAHTGADGLALLDDAPAENADEDFGLAFVDMMLPDTVGIDVLREIKRRRPQMPVVIMTGFASKESAVEAMRLGAYDYLSKPFNVADVSLIAKRALERNRLIDENRYLREELRDRYNFDNIVGSSEKIQAAYVLAAKVATQNATVLITGESGTGKEMLARTVHYQSNRADKPFVKVNCAALPEHLLEDELFGHEKGAFTDAHTQRVGRFEWAHSGTLFLDEIGEIPLPVQVKLLRVLQEREFERIGSSKTIKVDVRIIAATNKDLQKAIEEGTFREDLFYRLNVVPIELPPLRERPEDIGRLVEHFIAKYCDETGRERLKVSDEASRVLREQPWRGNIRELENCIERAVILAEDDTIEPRHLLVSPGGLNAQTIQTQAMNFNMNGGAPSDEKPLPTLREAEQQLIEKALERANGDENQAAQLLDIDVESLRSRLNSEADAMGDKSTSGAKRARKVSS